MDELEQKILDIIAVAHAPMSMEELLRQLMEDDFGDVTIDQLQAAMQRLTQQGLLVEINLPSAYVTE